MKNPSILSPSQSKPNPPKVDIFWDGVGGSFSGTVLQVQNQRDNSKKLYPFSLQHMSMFGRVIMVGNLACYNQVQVIRLKTMPRSDVKKKLNQITSFCRKQLLFLPLTWQSSLRNSLSLVSMFTGKTKLFQDKGDCPRL